MSIRRALHALARQRWRGADRVALRDLHRRRRPLASAQRLREGDARRAICRRLARLAEVWEKISRAARDTEAFNLDRKPLVFSVFGLLARGDPPDATVLRQPGRGDRSATRRPREGYRDDDARQQPT